MIPKTTPDILKELERRFGEQVRFNVPLAPYTTYRVGGPAMAYSEPESRADLQALVRFAHEHNLSVFILGGGANILVSDRGVEALVIRLNRCCNELERKGNEVRVGSGVTVKKLVEFCEAENLAGLDFMSGIPGTVGGALRMNAGAFVGEIGDRVIEVEAMDYAGNTFTIPGPKAGFGYRRADNLQDKILLGCRLGLEPGDREALSAARQSYLAKREARQPLDYGSCGSVFKRPPGNYAGTLIEKAGCKGMQIGGAIVSPKHANFILNYQDAKAEDIYRLICAVQQKVYQQFGIWLEPEVKLVGFTSEEIKSLEQPK
ncbi:MAG: UDP-N-acetylmuramate dehydrogenase [Calditrichia bacterium]